jgi:hypothetical protein
MKWEVRAQGSVHVCRDTGPHATKTYTIQPGIPDTTLTAAALVTNQRDGLAIEPLLAGIEKLGDLGLVVLDVPIEWENSI